MSFKSWYSCSSPSFLKVWHFLFLLNSVLPLLWLPLTPSGPPGKPPSSDFRFRSRTRPWQDRMVFSCKELILSQISYILPRWLDKYLFLLSLLLWRNTYQRVFRFGTVTITANFTAFVIFLTRSYLYQIVNESFV